MFHARPHLETHTRDAGQSAVAGAAYRLGLKLYDRRLQRSFDFRKRAVGEEIVYQTTVAPPGAPSWATDPLELWNRVEAAERRKDSQIARDYRVPLPLGLPDDDVKAMALEIAEHIARKLQIPVSIGVHRDARRDAFGAVKAGGQVGCHAHLYFPTRSLLFDEAAAEDEQRGGSGMGAKLHFLARSSTSALFVDDLNQFWAEAANRFAVKHGINPDFDHRSYRRMGLKMPTQPKLGAAATAMERKRIATQRGDRIREAKAMSKAYQTAHARRIAQIIRQAEADRLRGTEDGSAGGRMPDARPTSNLTSPRPSDIHVGRAPVDPRSLPLLERFKAVYLAGMEEGSRPEQTWVFGLVVAIDRALRRLQEIGALVFQHEARRREAMATQRDADAELAQWRREQADLADAAAAALPKRTPLERVVLDMNAWLNPKDPIEFTHPERAKADHQEEFLIYRSTTAARRLSDIEEQMRPIKKKVVERRSHLKRRLADLAAANEQALPQLVLASHAEEREWIEQYMPALLGPSHDIPTGEGSTGRFEPPTVTPRRPKGGM